MSEHATSPGDNPQSWLDQHGDYLFRYALIRVSDRGMAEDLVQETFLAALKSYSTFDRNSSIRTWLTGILRHKVMDHFRHIYKSEKNKIELESGNMDDFIEQGKDKGRWRPGHAPGDWSDMPDNNLQQKEFMAVLKGCLGALPERIASVFKLSELDGLDTVEICKELGITSTNYWVIMHRARTGLRRCLEIQWFDKASTDKAK
ncbi:MAG TPA: sigma-70 family RNA polymerase sigma factor [Balneolales bacterium]|nr:sigma-70 family RNA polymerase sigma factor [Balneolales bacterium]